MNSKMPKGVEHMELSDRIYNSRGVMNSKMPKGVEHFALDENGVPIPP